MSEMTLEQVRDKLRRAGRFVVYNFGETVWAEDLADAIDKHLANNELCIDEGCDHHGIDHVCLAATNAQTVDVRDVKNLVDAVRSYLKTTNAYDCKWMAKSVEVVAEALPKDQ